MQKYFNNVIIIKNKFGKNRTYLILIIERIMFMNQIKKGKYRHFKGNDYEVIGIAKNSETLEEMVVYRALYGDMELWIRPASMWNEEIERDGKIYKRFTYVDE